MKNDTDSKSLVQIIRESYNESVEQILEDLDVIFPISGKKEIVPTAGLKIKDKKGRLYVIDSIGSWGAMLVPTFKEDSTIKVSIEDLEKNYEL